MLRVGPLSLAPRMLTSPSYCPIRPARMRNNVVLPQPDGPTRLTNSPGATDSEIWPSADTVSAVTVRYVLLTPATAIIGSSGLAAVVGSPAAMLMLQPQPRPVPS